MPNIQQIQSTPDYISTFINKNLPKLLEIYELGIQEHNIGCLGMKCSQVDNVMDVYFMDESIILQELSPESWEHLKLSLNNDKKLFIVKDIDINAIFLIYI